MTTDLTDRILRQARALVPAIETLGTIQPTGPYERALARLWVNEEILSMSERIGYDSAVLWISHN